MATEPFVPTCALVVGASRGIGLAVTATLLAQFPHLQVYATRRRKSTGNALESLAGEHSDRLSVIDCDVTDDDSLRALSDVLKTDCARPDLALNAAGILHEPGLDPEKALGQLRRENLARIFDINSFGPILLAREILPLMPRNRRAHFAALSAMVGSIGDNRLGGWYGYRSSKAALNQLLKTLAIECRRVRPQLCVTAIHPGTTDTGLSRPFQANVDSERLYPPARSARRILDVICSAGPGDSGRFLNWDGSSIPW